MSPVTRRSFLKKTAAAGAVGFGIPTIIPRTALSSDSAPGANERVGVGYIGVGRRGATIA